VNLLLNAADAIGDDGGEIRVETRAGAGPEVELDIHDNGRGIDPEDLSRIFEPFFTTKGAHGTGLGLAVTWGILDSHAGSIQATSEPGQGTCFMVRLPLAHQVSGSAPNPSSPAIKEILP
jgi:two-component system NtrC family sensor kinase